MKEYLDVTLDNEFQKIDTLNWLPFIGKKYFSTKDRTLIVGESHYVPIGEEPKGYSHDTWTREFILKDGLQLKPWYQGSTKNKLIREVEKTLCKEENNSIWNELAYFNLIQQLLPSRKGRPTRKDIVEGLVNFRNVFGLLDPSIIIFCGVEASKHFYNSLNNEDFKIEKVELECGKINGTYPKKFKLLYDNKMRMCFFIKHPSGPYPYSSDKWARIIEGISN